MQFLNYGNVESIILKSEDDKELCRKIDELGRKQDLIDLQYSTTTLTNGSVEYSALALVEVN